MIIDPGSLILVKHKQKNIIHYQYEEFAIRYHGRMGLIIERIETPEWMQVYNVLVGKENINLGRGWIELVSDIYHQSNNNGNHF